jgi:DUF1009 family protein
MNHSDARVLVLDKGGAIMLNMPEVIALADECGISIIGM